MSFRNGNPPTETPSQPAQRGRWPRAAAAALLLAVALGLVVRSISLRPLPPKGAPGPQVPQPGAPRKPEPVTPGGPRAIFRSLELAREDEEKMAEEEAGTYTFAPLPGRSVALAERRLEAIAGRVVDSDGRGLPGARVWTESYSAESAIDGTFALPRTSGPVSIEHPEHFPRTVDGSEFATSVARVFRAGEGASAFSLVFEDSPKATEIALRPGSRILGRVVESGGAPIARARVQFGDEEGSPEAFSGPDGTYASPLLRHGVIHVHASHPEYQPRSLAVTISFPGRSVRCDFALERGEKLTVIARDPLGKPVADASAWIRCGKAPPPTPRRPGAPAFSLPEGSETPDGGEWQYLGRTDDLGRLETCRDPGCAAVVRVSAPAYWEEVRSVSGREVEMTLRPAPAITGDAVDASSGLPRRICGIRLLELRGADYEDTPHRGLRFASLEKGRFIAGLPPRAGTYRVAVEAEGDYHGLSSPFVFDGTNSPTAVLVRLEFRLELRGIVRDREGPMAGVEIELLALEEGPAERRLVFGIPVPAALSPAEVKRSGADGRFSFRGLRPGTYRLRAACPGRARFLSPPLEPPWEGEYPIILERGGILDGTLQGPDGQAQTDVPLVLVGGDGYVGFQWTDSEGRFEFDDLSPGREYELFVADPRKPDSDAAVSAAAPEPKAHRVLIPEGGRCALHIQTGPQPAGSVHGRIALEGRPLPGVPLRIERLGDPRADVPEPTVSGPDGSFAWRGLTPGTYRILAGAQLEGVALEGGSQVAVKPGRRASVEASVRAVSYSLRFVDLEGKLIETPIEVECSRQAPRPELRSYQELPSASYEAVSSGGRVRFVGLLPGNYRVRARIRGYLVADAARRVAEDAEETLAIPPLRTVRVRVQTPEGKPFRGDASVTVLRDGREIFSDRMPVEEEIEVTVVGPGEYELTIRTPEATARTSFLWGERGARSQPGG